MGSASAVMVGRAPTPALNRVFGVDLDDRDLVAQFNGWFADFHAVAPYQVLGKGDRTATAPAGFTRVPDCDHVFLEKDNLDDTGEPQTSQDDIVVDEIGRNDTETFVRIYAEAFNYPSSIIQPPPGPASEFDAAGSRKLARIARILHCAVDKESC